MREEFILLLAATTFWGTLASASAAEEADLARPRATLLVQADPSLHVYDVRERSVVCDGKSDQASALQAVLEIASKHERSIVLFPPSPTPCLVSRALRVPDGVTLWSRPGKAEIKATPDNKSNPLLLALGNRVRVHGLSFDGGGVDHVSQANVIQGYRVTNVILDLIAVRNTRGIGVLFSSDIRDTVIRDSRFENIGNFWRRSQLPSDRRPGLVFCCGQGNTGNSLLRNTFRNIGLDALQISDQEGAKVVDNRFDLEVDQPHELRAPDYPAAIFALRASAVEIRGNAISGAPGNCIDAPGVKSAVISENAISGCGYSGIGIFDTSSYPGPLISSERVLVARNMIAKVGLWTRKIADPITVPQGGIDVVLTDNRIAKNDRPEPSDP